MEDPYERNETIIEDDFDEDEAEYERWYENALARERERSWER